MFSRVLKCGKVSLRGKSCSILSKTTKGKIFKKVDYNEVKGIPLWNRAKFETLRQMLSKNRQLNSIFDSRLAELSG